MMEDMNNRMDSSKLKLANLIRASLPESGLDNMHYFNGSYMEGIDGDKDYLAEEIKAAQTVAREEKIIAFCMNLGDEIPNLMNDVNGHLILNASLQERMDFSLAMFLISAEEYSYFLMHDGYNVNPNASAVWMKRFAEYDKPLGPPIGPATQSGYIYTREFEHASVWLDLSQEKGEITWDTDPVPEPEPENFSLKFVVREANSPSYVSGALISLDSLSKSTNLAGVQYFVLDSGNYNFNISMPGFFTIESYVNINSDTVINLSMRATTADVKFRISEDEQAAVSANVSLNDDSLQTNSVGLAVYSNLPVDEKYSYSISKTGFATVSGNFQLEKDTTINIQLAVQTSIHSSSENTLRIYPVPSDNYLVLESEFEISEIRLIDMEGRLLLSGIVNSRTIREELPDGMPSMYLVNVLFKDGSSTTKRMIGI
jgi:hypothetical protein